MDRLSLPVVFMFHCIVTTASLPLFTSSAITSFLLVDAATVRKPPPILPSLDIDHTPPILPSFDIDHTHFHKSLNIQNLNHAIRHATDYLLRHCNDEGKFTYQADTVDANRFADSVKYNMLRHSGAIFALSQAYARWPNKSIPPVWSVRSTFSSLKRWGQSKSRIPSLRRIC